MCLKFEFKGPQVLVLNPSEIDLYADDQDAWTQLPHRWGNHCEASIGPIPPIQSEGIQNNQQQRIPT